MKKWWGVWFLIPAVVNIWWESKPKEKRDNAIKNVTDIFAFTGKRWEKIWEKPQKPKPKPTPQVVKYADFDVVLIDGGGRAHGRTPSSVFEKGRSGKVDPGVYEAIEMSSPSMDAMKYVNYAFALDRFPTKRHRLPIKGGPKHIHMNDTFEMSVAMDINEFELGELIFRWECV